MNIKSVSYAHIDSIWAAEFRGFFYGDGSVSLSKSKRKGSYLYRPRLGIVLRLDSLPVLKDIQSHVGGGVDEHVKGYTNNFGYKSNPTARWRTNSYSNIFAIIRDILLPGALLPATKRVEIETMYEMIQLRLQMPLIMKEEHKSVLDNYYLRLRELKCF